MTSKERSKIWREANPNANIQYIRRVQASDPLYYYARLLFWGARQRAKRRGMAFELDLDWVLSNLQGLKCSVTGLTLEILGESNNGRYHNPWAPSLDRRDNNLGYTKENTRVVAWIYNQAKNNFTTKELEILARGIIGGCE